MKSEVKKQARKISKLFKDIDKNIRKSQEIRLTFLLKRKANIQDWDEIEKLANKLGIVVEMNIDETKNLSYSVQNHSGLTMLP